MAHKVSRRLALIIATLTLAMGIPLGIALAAHFGDVPNSHPFHSDIAAISDAGVTSGCGGGDFCPDREVTRAEMAAFLNRLGALGPTKVPVVNADRLDGLDSSDLLTSWALVNADGTIADQSGGITMAATTGSGGFYLDFGFDTSGHAIMVSIKYRNAVPTNSEGFATVSPCGNQGTTCTPGGTNNTDHVWVLTQDPDGTNAPLPFYVAVLP